MRATPSLRLLTPAAGPILRSHSPSRNSFTGYLVGDAPGYITGGLFIFAFVGLWLIAEVAIYYAKRHQFRPPKVSPVPPKTMRKYDDHD